jgi:hypothetical protein
MNQLFFKSCFGVTVTTYEGPSNRNQVQSRHGYSSSVAGRSGATVQASVCLRSRHNDHRAPFPFLPSATEILPRPRPPLFPAKLLHASPLTPPADRSLRGLFTNLPASDRSLARERNHTTPSTLLFTLSHSCPVISRRTRVHGRWRSGLFVFCVYNLAGLPETCLGGGFSSGMRLP